MPTNLYGPGDNYHPDNSHVIPAMIRRFHEAKQADAPHVSIWGSGTPRREFLYVDDMAKACLHVMQTSPAIYRAHTQPMQSHLNVGSGIDITIADLARAVATATGYVGDIVLDTSKPDGAPRKLMNSNQLNQLGWQATTDLTQGLALAYQDFMESHTQ
jgi:GDP-L-fucose synthase